MFLLINVQYKATFFILSEVWIELVIATLPHLILNRFNITVMEKNLSSHMIFLIITDLTTGEKWNVCIQDERLVMKFHCVTFSSFFSFSSKF